MRLVQCWDDGVVDDIRLTELLRRYRAEASFNLNFAKHQPQRTFSWKYQGTKDVWNLSVDELRSVYDGFLVANHTLTHPHLTELPPPEMRREIAEGRDKLEQHFGYEVRGFAYPFGDHNPAVMRAVRETGHWYARTVLNADTVFPPEDAMALASTCHHQDPEFWARYERVRGSDADGQAVFYFWGHSYEFVTEQDWADFEQKLHRLSNDTQARWCRLPELFAP